MTHTTCSQCGSVHGAKSYPRFIRDDRDARTCIRPIETLDLAGKEHRITWVERIFCDCQWAAMLKLVDVRLLELLLPDHNAQHEIRRRAA